MDKFLVFCLVDTPLCAGIWLRKTAWIDAALAGAYGFLVYDRALVAIFFALFGFVAAVIIGNILERIGRFWIRIVVRTAICP